MLQQRRRRKAREYSNTPGHRITRNPFIGDWHFRLFAGRGWPPQRLSRLVPPGQGPRCGRAGTLNSLLANDRARRSLISFVDRTRTLSPGASATPSDSRSFSEGSRSAPVSPSFSVKNQRIPLKTISPSAILGSNRSSSVMEHLEG
jgi:hypothetical protein